MIVAAAAMLSLGSAAQAAPWAQRHPGRADRRALDQPANVVSRPIGS